MIAAQSKLRNTAFGEARCLVGLNLHMQSTQAGSKMAHVRRGDIILAFPDRVTGHIKHRSELTYADGRDAATFADDLFVAVEVFMDEMLTGLETHIPDRFKVP